MKSIFAKRIWRSQQIDDGVKVVAHDGRRALPKRARSAGVRRTRDSKSGAMVPADRKSLDFRQRDGGLRRREHAVVHLRNRLRKARVAMRTRHAPCAEFIRFRHAQPAAASGWYARLYRLVVFRLGRAGKTVADIMLAAGMLLSPVPVRSPGHA